MKKSYISIIILLVIVFIIGFWWATGEIKYFNVRTTDLGDESINNIYLNENYDSNRIEEVFGKVTHKTEKDKYTDYEFGSTANLVVSIRVENNKIIGIYTQDYSNNLKTKKAITFLSTFEEVVEAYGDNYIKSNYKGEMGSGDYYDVTYVDKKHRHKLMFEFVQVNNRDKLNFIGLSKY
jgi:hypothetical protein